MAILEQSPVPVWGIPFAPWNFQQTIDVVEKLVESGRSDYFMTANLDTVMLAAKSPSVKAVVDGAAFVLADGMPVVWGSWLRSRRLPGRVTGADLFPALCERAAQKGYRIFFLGGPPGVGEIAAQKLVVRFPGLQVVGVESPPYRSLTEQEEAELLERIRIARPNLLFVAFGQPKGELWVHRNYSRLEGTICVQIGAALDFAAGRISRAPRWMQRTGLEWVYRLSREPRRLMSRYARNALFLGRAAASDLRTWVAGPRRSSD